VNLTIPVIFFVQVFWGDWLKNTNRLLADPLQELFRLLDGIRLNHIIAFM
jgi:hypothetical protein